LENPPPPPPVTLPSFDNEPVEPLVTEDGKHTKWVGVGKSGRRIYYNREIGEATGRPSEELGVMNTTDNATWIQKAVFEATRRRSHLEYIKELEEPGGEPGEPGESGESGEPGEPGEYLSFLK
jgi:hypothetical protein